MTSDATAKRWTLRRLTQRKRRGGEQPHVLIVVQNLPVPQDRRVWLECLALRDAGYQVSVICPQAPGDPASQELEGVALFKYPPPPATAGIASYLWEFSYCWMRTASLALRIQSRERIDVLQACNPPDTYFALALLLRPFKVRFVFDQHDLVPEMLFSRFGKDRGILAFGLRLLERWTYRVADHVVTTNDSYASIIHARGGLESDDVTVVRSAPDPQAMKPEAAAPALRKGREHLVCWLGVMGPQDGVDVALRAARRYVYDLGRSDCHFAFLGSGDAYDDLQRLAHELKLNDWVTFTGWADREMIRDYLSTAAVGLVPDPKTPYADLSTHNKTLEYMAYGVPVLTFDLKETRRSAGEAAVVVPADDIEAFTLALANLMDDAGERARLGKAGRRHIVESMAWQHQIPSYLAVYERLLA